LSYDSGLLVIFSSFTYKQQNVKDWLAVTRGCEVEVTISTMFFDGLVPFHLVLGTTGDNDEVYSPWQAELYMYSVCQKIPLCGFLTIFSKRLEIFNQFFTHQLYVPFYSRLQIFIELFPTLTKLCHTMRNHPANFYISLER